MNEKKTMLIPNEAATEKQHRKHCVSTRIAFSVRYMRVHTRVWCTRTAFRTTTTEQKQVEFKPRMSPGAKWRTMSEDKTSRVIKQRTRHFVPEQTQIYTSTFTFEYVGENCNCECSPIVLGRTSHQQPWMQSRARMCVCVCVPIVFYWIVHTPQGYN